MKKITFTIDEVDELKEIFEQLDHILEVVEGFLVEVSAFEESHYFKTKASDILQELNEIHEQTEQFSE